MKNIAVSIALIALGGTLAAAPVSADKVQLTKGKVLVTSGGATTEIVQEVTMPFSIAVQTNGTYTVKGGKARPLQEGEILDRNGMLLRPNGTITPVFDHVTMNRGRVTVMKDGELAELKGRLQLGDGSAVSSDGYLTPSSGVPRRLLDGELFQLDGASVAARDTISMQKGRVLVQKDGSTLTVDPRRTITMNDGTKVFGDGTIIRFNGEQTKLTEGQTITLEGVQRK